MRVSVTVATRHGATGEIASAIAEALDGRGLSVTVAAPDEVATLEGCDAVVLGSAVYAGHWLDAATALVDRVGDGFLGVAVWLFSSGRSVTRPAPRRTRWT